jgi:hypothetical protein
MLNACVHGLSLILHPRIPTFRHSKPSKMRAFRAAAELPHLKSTTTTALGSVVSRAMSVKAPEAGAKLWGGRFTGKVDPLMEAFNNSIRFDRRLWQHDIEGSQAYARALHRCHILTEQETKALVEGLQQVRAPNCHSYSARSCTRLSLQVGNEWKNGTFDILPADEDIHTANERRLGEFIGPLAGKLHTGRR